MRKRVLILGTDSNKDLRYLASEISSYSRPFRTYPSPMWHHQIIGQKTNIYFFNLGPYGVNSCNLAIAILSESPTLIAQEEARLRKASEKMDLTWHVLSEEEALEIKERFPRLEILTHAELIQ